MSMARSLWILARPRGMLLVALLPLVGFAFAQWDHGCELPGMTWLPPVLTLLALWAVPHAGTMWLNAALDRDDKATLFGAVATVPRGIEYFAYPTLAFSVIGALYHGSLIGLCVIGCAVLSIVYSHPRTQWKGHAWLGPLANALGYAVLSPLGGWALADRPPTLRLVMVIAIAVPWILAAYFAAQAFQQEEDRERGYRTLVATHGALATLKVTRGLFALALGATLLASAVGYFPRAVLLAAPLFFWVDRVLVEWMRLPDGGDESWARRFFVRLTIAGLAVLLLVSLQYEWQRSQGGPLGGRGTAMGRPDPIVCIEPWNLPPTSPP